MLNRRRMLTATTGAAFGAAGGSWCGRAFGFATDEVEMPFGNGARRLAKYPGKRPMIVLTSRPPQLETPFTIFNEGVVTPNDAFFVRYHLADIPLTIDPESFRLTIKGEVERPLSLSIDELRNEFQAIETVAVNQCSGNSRGFFQPRVAGGQLGNGAMGNARWTGVPLKSILDRAGVKAGAVQVSFQGLDRPVVPETPQFVKALDIDHARDGEVMIAYAMNGEQLPWLNGFPIRLVVPAFYGTYWVKHLNEITVLDKSLDNYWMQKAYRIPDNACACTEPGQQPTATVPINRLNVRSFITNIADGARVRANANVQLRGMAFDGGFGITQVAISLDHGASWNATTLGDDLGKYSFREWKSHIKLPRGEHLLMVRATNAAGETQPLESRWNPPGYMRNVVEKTRVFAA